MCYKTFLNSFKTEFKEKKSLFICLGQSVKTESGALLLVNEIKIKYFDARHVVYAYRFFEGVERFDGSKEPKGASGEVILKAVKNNNLNNVLIVVVRYFGGILLGRGALARTYRKASRLVILGAKEKFLSLCVIFFLEIKYNFINVFLKLVSDYNIRIIQREYGEKIKLKCACRKKIFSKFSNIISNVSSGEVRLNLISEDYFEKTNSKINV